MTDDRQHSEMPALSAALVTAFVAATATLMLIPGLNVALIVADRLCFGVRGGLITEGADKRFG
jgi:hypothetical protein